MRLKLVVLGIAGLALLGGYLSAVSSKQQSVVDTAARNVDKEEWVNQRRMEQEQFYTDYVNGMVRINVSVYDLDPETLTERYGQDLQPFSIYTKEGYRFVARYKNGRYEWSFIPPGTAQIYTYAELSSYLADVKKNQIP